MRSRRASRCGATSSSIDQWGSASRCSGVPRRLAKRAGSLPQPKGLPHEVAGRSLQFQQPALLAHVHRPRFADSGARAGGLVDMPAIEILRLFPQQKIAHGRGPAMQAGADLVERRTQRRVVADEHQRRESREAFELLRQFRLAVFAGRVEGRWIGISQSGHLIAAPLRMLLGEVWGAEGGAAGGGLRRRFVIARQHVNATGAAREDLAAAIEAPPEVHQVARGHVVIRFRVHQPRQRAQVAVYVGKDEQLHRADCTTGRGPASSRRDMRAMSAAMVRDPAYSASAKPADSAGITYMAWCSPIARYASPTTAAPAAWAAACAR